jgi:hypothetical protein
VFAGEKLSFEVLVANDPTCVSLAAELQEHVTLNSFTAPKTHSAGSFLKFEMTLSKTDKLDSEKWLRDYSSANLNSIIASPYTKFIHHNPKPSMEDFFFDAGDTMTFTVATEVAKNIGGNAYHRLSLTLPNQQGEYCTVGVNIGSALEITSDSTDITPPLVRSIVYDKLSYRPGDNVTVIFELSEPLKAPESDHLQFSNRNIPRGGKGRSMPPYDANVVHRLKQLGATTYSFTFQVPMEIQPGPYHPDYFNRFDSFGNFEDEIGGEDGFEKSVADTSPLVVVTDEFARVDEFIERYRTIVKEKRDQFNQIPANSNDKTWVKAKLSHMVDIDQYTRSHLNTPQDQNYSETETNYFWTVFGSLWMNLDFRNTEELKPLIAIWSWFSKSTFGEEADQQAWLLVQHADHDRAFQKAILAKLEKLYPTNETSPRNYAYLYDRVAASWHNPDLRSPQRYGTQGMCVRAGVWEPLPIENPERVDERRREVGLGTLQEYIVDISQVCR